MPSKPTTPKTAKPRSAAARTTTPRAAGTAPRKLTKPKLVHSEGAPNPAPEPEGEGFLATAEHAVEKAVTGAGLRLKDLVERVVAATGGKKKGVKEIVEATLTQMGDALQRGESLHLPNFGKARVAKSGKDSGSAMTVKLRRGTGDGGKGKAAAAAAEDKDALADEGDQG